MSEPRAPGQSFVTAERALISVGAGLLAAAPYVSWVHVVLLGDFTLPALLAAAKVTTAPAYLLTAVAVGILIGAFLTPRLHLVRVIALTSGSTLALLGGPGVYSLIHEVDAAHGLAQVGLGTIAAAVGCVLLLAPPIIGLVRDAHQPWRVQRQFVPAAVPLIVAGGVAACYLLLPVRDSLTNYCGNPIASQFKPPHRMPPDAPPEDVGAKLQDDQSQLASAQQAAGAQQQTDSTAQQEQATADNLTAKAQQADNDANNAANQAATDQGTVDSDQSNADSAAAAVSADQSTVQSDQQTIASDQSNLASDRTNGFDTTYDQDSLTRDQQTLATDQHTFASDGDALAAAQSKLAQDKSTLATAQNLAAAAQKTATTLDAQAQAAQDKASQDGASAGTSDATVAQQLDQAQQQLANDQQTWQATHDAEVTAVRDYNTALASCQDQTGAQLAGAGIVAVIGALWSAGVARRHRRLRSAAVRPGSGTDAAA